MHFPCDRDSSNQTNYVINISKTLLPLQHFEESVALAARQDLINVARRCSSLASYSSVAMRLGLLQGLTAIIIIKIYKYINSMYIV